jgi:hypothetical protein
MRLRIYSPEKTLADCFKYRNELGLDTALAGCGKTQSGDPPAKSLLPAGVIIAPCIYLVHRRPQLWPEPEKFNPDRFLDARPGRPAASILRRTIVARFVAHRGAPQGHG